MIKNAPSSYWNESIENFSWKLIGEKPGPRNAVLVVTKLIDASKTAVEFFFVKPSFKVEPITTGYGARGEQLRS